VVAVDLLVELRLEHAQLAQDGVQLLVLRALVQVDERAAVLVLQRRVARLQSVVRIRGQFFKGRLGRNFEPRQEIPWHQHLARYEFTL
jgi:hypothetical protein